MNSPDPVGSPGSYEGVLRKALETAELGRNDKVAQTLTKMIAAVTDGKYGSLLRLWQSLPPVYQAVTGKPPRSREDDS